MALDIDLLGTYEGSKAFDESSAEIVAFDKHSNLLLITNAYKNAVDVVNITDPTAPAYVKSLNATGLSPNGVAIYNGLAAVAVEAEIKTNVGSVDFYDMKTNSGSYLGSVEVGVLPDALTFSPDGYKVIVSCEGEPNDEYSIDPAGSVAVIDTSSGYAANMTVDLITFNEFDGMEDDLRSEGVRIYGPNASASQDFEPEYATISADSKMAVVVLQENNAFAHINLETKKIVGIVPIGFKNHTLEGNKFDASNRDGGINITNWPTLGMYQPDGLTSFVLGGKQYYASANEGDSRDYAGYSEEERVEDLTLSPELLATMAGLQEDENLGRLKTTTADGDDNGDGIFQQIYSYGGRSFSIFDENLTMVYDSGSILEEITADAIPANFNANNDENDSFDSRSDDKGPEPEAVVYANIHGHHYLFVLLERVSGIAVFCIDDPTKPTFDQFFHNRDFDGVPEEGTAGDLGPESGLFISEDDSPTGDALLIVANEVSGTTSIYRVKDIVSSSVGTADHFIAAGFVTFMCFFLAH